MNKNQKRSQATRSHILATAEFCFGRTGYDGTSVSRICQEANVSKGAFYHHFDSKQAVFLALLERWLANMDEEITGLSDDAIGVSDKLLGMARIIGQILQVPNDELLIYQEYLNQAVRVPELWQKSIQPYFQYRETLTALISEGVKEGELAPNDPKTAAILIVAMALGLLIQGFLDPDGADWDMVTEQGMGFLIAGFKAPTGGR